MNSLHVKHPFLVGLVSGSLIAVGLLIRQASPELTYDLRTQSSSLAAYYWPESRLWRESDGTMRLIGEPGYLKVRVPIGYRHLKIEINGERASDQPLSLGLVSKGGIQLIKQDDSKNFEADLDLSIAERERGFISIVFSAEPMKTVIGFYEVRLKVSDPVWGQGSGLSRLRSYFSITAQDLKQRISELL